MRSPDDNEPAASTSERLRADTLAEFDAIVAQLRLAVNGLGNVETAEPGEKRGRSVADGQIESSDVVPLLGKLILLVAGLGWSAMHLPQQALALVSASIGAAISHLLAERNAVGAPATELADVDALVENIRQRLVEQLRAGTPVRLA